MADVGVPEVGSEEKDGAPAPSPDPQMDTKESPDSQNTANPTTAENVPKDWKAWSMEETREMIHLYKTYSRKYPEYTRKLLWQEISQGLKKRGYVKGPERIRNRMKSLKTSFQRVREYNASHILKKDFPYMDDLLEIYGSGQLSDDNSSSSGTPFQEEEASSNASYSIASNDGNPSKKLRLVRMAKMIKSEPDANSNPYHTPNMGYQKPGIVSAKKKVIAPKKDVYPLYQCGLCNRRFSSSQEMHSHRCDGEKPVVNSIGKKKMVPSGTQNQNGRSPFQWNGMSTLKFLELLKEFKIYSRNFSSKSGNILDELSMIMCKEGIDATPEDLEKKWKCLASTYEKTVIYNKKHQDKKKCAFFNRLSELYKHGASLDMFKQEEPVKMTVEVSPFSFSSSNWYSTPNSADFGEGDAEEDDLLEGKMPAHIARANYEKMNGPSSSGSGELVQWLDMFWKEWKELERKREAAQAQRHSEMMEVLSFIAESFAK